ncbi:hypothetical protein MJO28_009828 [Puccinia striiformis f. sp. tritici]|uniref:Uncharacterized protein n=1 Tax=Puccinia striiformis f. sp. tritici TaxID=168172 RepID=A0ACC0E9U0_9BASI|nr:hypothetical protein MJO28_009828 [Puccinia striiformis f. sp. tritici]
MISIYRKDSITWVIEDLDDRPRRLQMLQMLKVSQTTPSYSHATTREAWSNGMHMSYDKHLSQGQHHVGDSRLGRSSKTLANAANNPVV